MNLPLIVISYLIIMNLTGFALMGIDKQKARKKAWRIPEATLFLFALCGGSIGSIIGMYAFRHKTKHWYFVVGMPLILVLQLILFYMLSRMHLTFTVV
ncbi:MAG: DUF1294 domain-containing protein [Lachnospiraceae bacterium]|nr:DUF1294 domain-containing protein [Lachnospiraceae bacterium]